MTNQQSTKYNPHEIEAKWQQAWADHRVFKTPEGAALQTKPKYYILDMFPYPSGDGLHVGHPKGYTATDVIARFKRAQGYNVLHPMGWDAFGLPAERAADREGIHPAAITKRNVTTFRRQLQQLGLSYDWEREVDSSSPDYYRWTQWIFLKLYEKGLAYMADVPVNWCPALGTVLSNEEVQDGKYIETGDPIERRNMRQWMLKITAYAERLINDLDEVDWPESLKEIQRNWIGKSEGATITFPIQGTDHDFTVFTTRPDTLFGATYCVFAPEHPLVNEIATPEQRAAVDAYVTTARNKSERQRLAEVKEKTGVFTGAYAINPANGQPIPIWVADYVLMGYGTGAIMAVPGHDARDHEFARQFGLPIVGVISGGVGSGGVGSGGVGSGGIGSGGVGSGGVGSGGVETRAFTGDGVAVNSSFLDGLRVAEAKAAMINWLEAHGHGTREVQYRLRDWLFSRQRYWGEPFPIIHLEDGAMVTVPEAQLPVALPPKPDPNPAPDKKGREPNVLSTVPSPIRGGCRFNEAGGRGDEFGQTPLSRASDDWLMVTLPDGRTGVRETNTMPQWAGSCWYYLRFTDPHNAQEAWSQEAEQYWMPVDLYVGGVEHAVLHLLYARFWHKVLYDAGLVSTNEPFQKLFNQGKIGAMSFQDETGKYHRPHDVMERDGEWFVQATGQPVHTQYEKMGKSKRNVYSIDEVVAEFGADPLRLYELFMGPVSASAPWNMDGLDGVSRFLARVWRMVVDDRTGEIDVRITDISAASQPELNRVLHQTIQGVTESIESIDKLNTGVSRMMAFVNVATQAATLPRTIVTTFLRLLSPFAPHIAEELWARLGETDFIAHASWPVADPTLLVDEVIQVPVQVNGKLRTVLTVDAGSDNARLEEMALADEKITRYVDGKTVRRVIVVPKKLVNVIVG